MMQRAASLSLLVFTILLAPHARAQDYPDRPIRVIVSYSPGATDAAARTVARPMSAMLGKPIVIENKPGAEATIGNEYVAKAAPDGYTLLYMPSSTLLRPHIEEMSYDPLAFTPIGRTVGTVNILVIHAGHPARTMSDLMAFAKANPGKVSYGSVGGPSQLAADFLQAVSGVPFQLVPYKGSTQAMTDLLAGRLTFIFSGVGHVLANVKAGKLRVLAVSDGERHFQLPDVPTMAEAGLKAFDLPPIWHSFVGPANTGRPVVEKLSRALKVALVDPEVIKSINGQGYETKFSTPEELRAQMRKEYDTWAMIVKTTNFKKQTP